MKDDPHLLRAIATTVEKARKERKMTKTSLANFSDLQECYIRGITKGRRNPSIVAVYAICEALGIPPVEFFTKVTIEMERLKNEDQNTSESM